MSARAEPASVGTFRYGSVILPIMAHGYASARPAIGLEDVGSTVRSSPVPSARLEA